jgi:hypothetical protein
MTLLPDVSCSEVEPLEIRLQSLHEGENAGSLLGTRMRVLFLQHCRRREPATLWYSAQRLVKRPFFHVSCIEEFSYEIDKPPIMNMLFEYFKDQFMIELIKTL